MLSGAPRNESWGYDDVFMRSNHSASSGLRTKRFKIFAPARSSAELTLSSL